MWSGVKTTVPHRRACLHSLYSINNCDRLSTDEITLEDKKIIEKVNDSVRETWYGVMMTSHISRHISNYAIGDQQHWSPFAKFNLIILLYRWIFLRQSFCFSQCIHYVTISQELSVAATKQIFCIWQTPKTSRMHLSTWRSFHKYQVRYKRPDNAIEKHLT